MLETSSSHTVLNVCTLHVYRNIGNGLLTTLSTRLETLGNADLSCCESCSYPCSCSTQYNYYSILLSLNAPGSSTPIGVLEFALFVRENNTVEVQVPCFIAVKKSNLDAICSDLIPTQDHLGPWNRAEIRILR